MSDEKALEKASEKPIRAELESGEGSLMLLSWNEIGRILPRPMIVAEYALGNFRLGDHGLTCDYAFSLDCHPKDWVKPPSWLSDEKAPETLQDGSGGPIVYEGVLSGQRHRDRLLWLMAEALVILLDEAGRCGDAQRLREGMATFGAALFGHYGPDWEDGS